MTQMNISPPFPEGALPADMVGGPAMSLSGLTILILAIVLVFGYIFWDAELVWLKKNAHWIIPIVTILMILASVLIAVYVVTLVVSPIGVVPP